MENDIVVELQNVTKKIKGKTIIDNLSFNIRRGKIYGFLGPNGAGKTTTIRMMVSLMSLTSGNIIIEGHNIRTDRSRAIAHVGAIVENPEWYTYMTGRKNLLHFMRMSGKPTSEQRIQELIKLVGLENVLNKKVKTYSLGMKQRLGIAQALLHNPSILILDEPTNGLDPAGIRELRDYLRQLAEKENVSILVSSHLLSEIELMCDWVFIIQNGKLLDERSLHLNEENTQSTAMTIRFVVNDVRKATDILAAADWKTTPSEGDAIIAELKQDEISTAVQKLVQGGVLLYEVRPVTSTLEETFLSITKGGRIV